MPSGTFVGLTQLQTLDLRSNGIGSISSGAFARLTRLQRLPLGGNHIAFIPPGAFAELSELQMLFLSDNDIDSIPYGTIAGLTALQTLDLSSISTLACIPIQEVRRLQMGQGAPPLTIYMENTTAASSKADRLGQVTRHAQ